MRFGGCLTANMKIASLVPPVIMGHRLAIVKTSMLR